MLVVATAADPVVSRAPNSIKRLGWLTQRQYGARTTFSRWVNGYQNSVLQPEPTAQPCCSPAEPGFFHHPQRNADQHAGEADLYMPGRQTTRCAAPDDHSEHCCELHQTRCERMAVGL